MAKYLISYSGGLGSFAAAHLAIEKYGRENCQLVFTDTKTEDEDLYRFLDETSKAFGMKIKVLADGRNIWQVFSDVKFMGNSRVDPCSRVLKRELFRKYVDANVRNNGSTTVIFGIGPTEAHRMVKIKESYCPHGAEAPLIDEMMWPKDVLKLLSEYGIDPPRLYAQGFPHNNCGGFCVKTGQAQMQLLLDKNPTRYAWHEEQQEKLFKLIGKRRGFIRKTVDGKIYYLGLKEFRELVQSGGDWDKFDFGGCGCFV